MENLNVRPSGAKRSVSHLSTHSAAAAAANLVVSEENDFDHPDKAPHDTFGFFRCSLGAVAKASPLQPLCLCPLQSPVAIIWSGPSETVEHLGHELAVIIE